MMPWAPRWMLSHPLGETTPVWRDNPAFTADTFSSIGNGDVCNQQMFRFLNHTGTHVDAACHFDPDGRTITDYPPGFWGFSRPLLVDMPKGDDELITASDLASLSRALDDVDLLIIRTGYQRYRDDPKRFGNHAPGFAGDAASQLRSVGSLRAVGMDLPSASAPGHLEEGVAFHQEVLSDAPASSGTRGLVLIEDMNLAQALDGLSWVLVAPLLVLESDGAPVTVYAG